MKSTITYISFSIGLILYGEHIGDKLTQDDPKIFTTVSNNDNTTPPSQNMDGYVQELSDRGRVVRFGCNITSTAQSVINPGIEPIIEPSHPP